MDRRLLILGCLCLLPLVACDSNDGDGGANCGGTTGKGTFTATIPSGSFEARCLTGSFSSGVLSVGGNLGASASGGVLQEQITLAIPGAQAGRTYNFGSGPVATYTRVESSNPTNPNASYASTTGSVKVDAVSATAAKGTFSFTGRNNAGQTISISNGSFDVTF